MGLADLLSVQGGLEKLRISAFSDDEFTIPTGSFTVMYNPTTYSKEFKSEWLPPEGTDVNKDLEFRHLKSDTASFEFLFDATGGSPTSKASIDGSKISGLKATPGKDYDAIDLIFTGNNNLTGEATPVGVEEAIQKFYEITGEVQGDTHMPNFVQINWGTYEFKGVLASATVNYKLFNNAGIAIRATIAASFEESKSRETQAKEPNTNSPDLSHMVRFQAGDSIPLLAHRTYGDPALYLEIARINNMKNFRDVSVGKQLVLPPINKKNQ